MEKVLVRQYNNRAFRLSSSPDGSGSRCSGNQPAAVGKKEACTQEKLSHLQDIAVECAQWRNKLAEVRCMHGWVLSVEHVLDGSRAQPEQIVRNKTIASRLGRWREQMAGHLTDASATTEDHCCSL